MQVLFSTIINPMSQTASKRASKTMNQASVMRRAVDIVEKRDAKPVPHDKIKGIPRITRKEYIRLTYGHILI